MVASLLLCEVLKKEKKKKEGTYHYGSVTISQSFHED